MPRSRKIGYILFGILLFSAPVLHAQYGTKHKEKMNRAIENTMNVYVQTLSDLVDTDEDNESRELMLSDKVQELFVNTEIDLACSFCEDQKKQKPKDLFRTLLNNFEKSSNTPVKRNYDLETAEYFKLTESGKSKNDIYIRVRIAFDWQAKSLRGKNTIKDEKLWFVFLINTSSTNYVARIMNIDPEENKTNKEIPVLFNSDGANLLEESNQSKEYYLDRLTQAKYKMARKNIIEAYMYATEALKGVKILESKFADEAEKVKRDVRKTIDDNKLADKGDNASEYLQKNFIDQGKLAMNKGKIDLANSYYSLALNTGSPDYKQTEIQQQLERIGELKKKQNEIEALVKTKNFKEAISEYEELIGTDPKNSDYLSGLALLYALVDKKEKANDLFASAKNIDPKNERVYANEMESLYQKNQDLTRIDTLARKYLELAETGDPNTRRIKGIQAYAMAWRYKVNQNATIAMDSCNAAISHCPQLAEPYILKADLTSEVKDKQKILEEAMNAIQDSREKTKISKAKAAKGYGDAKQSYSEALQLDKTDPKSLLGIGKIFQDQALALNKTEPTSSKIKLNLDSAIYYLNSAKINFKTSTTHKNQDEILCALNLVRCYLFRDIDGDVNLAINLLEEEHFGEQRYKKQLFTQDAVYAYLKNGNSRKARDLAKNLKATSLDKLMLFLLEMDFDPNVINTKNEQDLTSLFRDACGPETSFFNADRIEKDLKSFGKPGLMENKGLRKALTATRRK